jgi:hypothetical protein
MPLLLVNNQHRKRDHFTECHKVICYLKDYPSLALKKGQRRVAFYEVRKPFSKQFKYKSSVFFESYGDNYLLEKLIKYIKKSRFPGFKM